MHLIDTHTHIYLPEFDDDRDACMERAKAAGVEELYLPAIDSRTHAAMLEVEQRYPACRAMMGLHPCSVTGRYEDELRIVAGYLAQRRFIAVGEIGLDYHWDKTFVREQEAAFRGQIEMALQYGLPVVIHSRNAIDESTAIVEDYPGLRGVFHCFSGDLAQARRILDTGFMLGIGGVLTFKKSGLDAVVAATGLEGLVLETDAPYLAPVPHRGKRNEPAYTALVAGALAVMTGRPLEEICKITSQNAARLFVQ